MPQMYRVWVTGPNGGHSVVVGRYELRRLIAEGQVVTIKEVGFARPRPAPKRANGQADATSPKRG
jgi:hypothetical protein